MNLVIRNLPEETHATLRTQAKKNHRSLNQEIVSLLVTLSKMTPEDDFIQVRKEEMRKLAARVDQYRQKMTGFASPQEIEDAIQEGHAE